MHIYTYTYVYIYIMLIKAAQGAYGDSILDHRLLGRQPRRVGEGGMGCTDRRQGFRHG